MPDDFRKTAFVHQIGGFGQVEPPGFPLTLLWPVIELVIDPQQEHPHLAEQLSFSLKEAILGIYSALLCNRLRIRDFP
jgi:hypothetical protein